MRRINFLLAICIALMPSKLKIFILRRLGARIGNDCYIGLSLITAREIIIGDYVYIAGFNLIHRLNIFYCGDGSRINGFNWITGANIGSFFLGRNSAVTRLHFFEASGDIYIYENSIIAGRGTHFFTHGISSTNLDNIRSIVIGPWCYIGSSSRFVPGSTVDCGTFVGMGSVLTKPFNEEFVVIAGNPARIRKHLSHEDAYFSRLFLPHAHHPAKYSGGRSDIFKIKELT